MRKLGEAQIIDFFSGYLKDVLREILGERAIYTVGNFSGSQDRKFSDFFAGTDSRNILVEFKEKKEEHKNEQLKPLRHKLCLALDEDISKLSRKCHFIGWNKELLGTKIELNAYIDLVCRLWGLDDYLITPNDYDHEGFVKDFIGGQLGVDHNEFVNYIGHLNRLAGGGASGVDVPFRSILYSRNDRGRLVGTRFDNLGQLSQLLNMANSLNPSPRGPSGSPGLRF